MNPPPSRPFCVGVLALQGAFTEHIHLLRRAFQTLNLLHWTCKEVRSPSALSSCDALIIPGGESTAIALAAERSGLLEPLRAFVKVQRRPTWGTCAGLILLAESANRIKKGGQELIGGLDVRVDRNHFGRQVESFQADVDLTFLSDDKGEEGPSAGTPEPFTAIFIRAPVVEKVLKARDGIQVEEERRHDTVVAPSKNAADDQGAKTVGARVEILGMLPGRSKIVKDGVPIDETCEGDIVAVRQENVFGTSFHPELTNDARIHVWWLKEIVAGMM